MLFVLRDRVGPVAFSRLERDGLIHEVLGGVAVANDVPSTRGLRMHMIAPLVPSHMWLTGLATLWLEGAAPPPRVIDVAGPRGAHRTVPSPGSPPLSFHSGWLGGLPDAAPPRVATVTRACLDALSHSRATEALPAVASAVRARATSIAELLAAVESIEAHTHYRARVESLVGALAALDTA